MSNLPDSADYLFAADFLATKNVAHPQMADEFAAAQPFPHSVFDDFLPGAHANFLDQQFPAPDHPVWLDWRTRHPAQYGKQGVGDASNFDRLAPALRQAINEFNSPVFLEFLECLTGISKLLPDPYFTGGGLHQILRGGILDVHTDFNHYKRLDLYRRLNVIVYLTREWQPEFGGELELWNSAPASGGVCAQQIEPVFNRCVVFKTDKTSFHGHPNEWCAPEPLTRRSLAFYYYTAQPEAGVHYDDLTDFQGVVEKPLPP